MRNEERDRVVRFLGISGISGTAPWGPRFGEIEGGQEVRVRTEGDPGLGGKVG